MHAIANKLLETVKPMLEKMADDTNEVIPESQLDATMKIVKLAKSLYEIDTIKRKMMMNADGGKGDMDMEYVGNPKKSY